MALDIAAISKMLEDVKPTLPLTTEDAQAIYDMIKPLAPDPYLVDVQTYRKGICVQIFNHDGIGLQRLLVRELFAVEAT